jgi:tRNA(Ile)-lysidine synthase
MTPSLLTIARRALAAGGECAVPSGTAVLVAVSGGPDSMALLSVLARLAPRAGLELLAHGIDHGLRPEAAAELDLAESFARSEGVPFDRSGVTVPRGGNLQARARTARWAELVRVARRRNAAIATAHHAGDRAETLLMRLLRGAGLRGLAVLPPRTTAAGTDDVIVVRPLLRAQRADILAHVRRSAVPFATDPSNADPRFLRVRVRHEVLPLLAALDPGIVRHLEAIADELAGGPRSAESPVWARALPRATQEALVKLATSGSRDARVWLPGGLVVSVDPDRRPRTNKARARTQLPAGKLSG